jgi:hypothetical protein
LWKKFRFGLERNSKINKKLEWLVWNSTKIKIWWIDYDRKFNIRFHLLEEQYNNIDSLSFK